MNADLFIYYSDYPILDFLNEFSRIHFHKNETNWSHNKVILHDVTTTLNSETS